jgi:hypothetical protein
MGGLTGCSNSGRMNVYVMCLSCHRAHGSPYNDMLRWDYDGMVAGNGSGGGNDGTGCFKCHSEKD